MTTNSTLLTIGVLTGLALAAARPANLSSAVVSNVSGSLRIQQPIPCGGMVEETTHVTHGLFEVTPAEGVDAGGGAKAFTLTRASVFFAGFSVSASCLGFDRTRTYGEIGVHVVPAVAFTAYPTPTPGVYTATIPRNRLVFSYATTIDGQLNAAYMIPREDAAATVDVAGRTMAMRVVLATHATFQAGCVLGRCVIDETHMGTVTASLTGTIPIRDADRDGVPDSSDNCRFTANPTQSPVSTPVIQAPPDVTVASCLTRRFGVPEAEDVCDGTRVVVTRNAPARFELGANTVVWRVEDGMHRVATDSQIVTVVDAERPTVSCEPMHPTGGSFRISAVDSCTSSPVIKLGAYVLAAGEIIKINETGQPGIRLRNVVGVDRIRHFQVGRGEAVITATDESNNVGSVVCSLPR